MTQQTIKLAKNAKCRCGSGRKYKRCCEPKHLEEANAHKSQPKGIKPPPSKLQNNFRKEIHAKNVSDEELMYRDQCVLLMEMENHHGRCIADAAHFRVAIESRKAELVAIKNLPACEGKQPSIDACEDHIKSLEGKLEACVLPRVAVIEMDALRQVVAMGVWKESPSSDGRVEELVTQKVAEPIDQKPTEKITQESNPRGKDGPIQTDGGGADDEDEDESLAEDKVKTEPVIVTP